MAGIIINYYFSSYSNYIFNLFIIITVIDWSFELKGFKMIPGTWMSFLYLSGSEWLLRKAQVLVIEVYTNQP